MARMAIAERRRLLIEAAWKVMSTEGVQAATTRAICAAAGMPQSSFHYCFESRSDLLRIVVTGLIPRQIEASFAAFEVSARPEDTISASLNAYWQDVVANPMEHAVLYDITMTALYDDELRDLASFQYGQYHETAITILTTASERLGLQWSTPIDVLAVRLVTFVDGLTLRYLATRDDELCRAALDSFAAELATHIAQPTA